MANQMFPEYVLADVIYLLSYDPKFVDQVSGPVSHQAHTHACMHAFTLLNLLLKSGRSRFFGT